MPIITINIFKRSIEEKREMTKKITDAVVEVTGFKKEWVQVFYNEVEPENHAQGGILSIDK